ncbi:MAG: 30S ribosomal protein S8 [Dehalococcoidia bacterium]|jgi:small subunit ribosomal protein S8
MVTDPIADMLTRIRNATMARHDFVLVPLSKVKLAVAKILRDEGFVKDYEVVKGKQQRVIKIYLKYTDKKEPVIEGLQRVSKPGLRIYVSKSEIPRVYGGLGMAILSTPKGIISGKKAWQEGVGGELICFVW